MSKRLIFLSIVNFGVVIVLINYIMFLHIKVEILKGDVLNVVGNIREACYYFSEQEFQQSKEWYELQIEN